ncbi:M14 family metallocarboxypeptidase [Pseudidiomarina sp. 1APR75-33.1]|uniref:M14 family metallopeptidase n=1 Tax=Pseudidiomarina terrestris TaxID=2820060 RepID=UPI002650A987|nr:M14 family metallocarboxypeptidase [Pseudidiomarina sp. 1APR75-33.1]MDN7126223.1 M14 family metallocarboxypeptidase [Pseudidiomarina sp. 1APR75-33.1]
MTQQYPIGTPGKPWGDEEKQAWFEQQSKQRDYKDNVIRRIDHLREQFDVETYGELNYDGRSFPLYVVRSQNWRVDRPTVLVTGGVHGYETSGVHGALYFLETEAVNHLARFNILVAPCVSPWGYETINRWNPAAVDPNRSFVTDSPAQEAALLMQYLEVHEIAPSVHVDLHETTDTDNSEFRPALAARNGTTNDNWTIPDGFYLVADSSREEPEFQRAIIETIKPVTHIAPPDESGCLIGAPMVQEGVIEYDAKELGLCMGMTNARFVTTTEVYPDSANTNPVECVDAQVAAVRGALEHAAGKC